MDDWIWTFLLVLILIYFLSLNIVFWVKDDEEDLEEPGDDTQPLLFVISTQELNEEDMSDESDSKIFQEKKQELFKKILISGEACKYE